MVDPLGEVTLKSGERVSAVVVRGPDAVWRKRITKLLGHKGDPWCWQNSELLTRETGIDAWFYLLHRDGQPLAHQMTAELNGVGIFGHVWTVPADRGQGAAGELMRLQMAHFRQRNGRALYLSTGFDSPAYRIYQKHGFAGIEPRSGYMTWSARPLSDFEADYFSSGPTTIEGLNWRHWPVTPALFMSAVPGIVRCAPLKLFGRKSTEGELLPGIQNRPQSRNASQVFVLQKSNGAVVGLAAWGRDELSSGVICADVFCHPAFWPQGEALLRHTLATAPAGRCVAYADATCPQKTEVLRATGFQPAATWPQHLARDAAISGFADLLMFERG